MKHRHKKNSAIAPWANDE